MPSFNPNKNWEVELVHFCDFIKFKRNKIGSGIINSQVIAKCTSNLQIWGEMIFIASDEKKFENVSTFNSSKILLIIKGVTTDEIKIR